MRRAMTLTCATAALVVGGAADAVAAPRTTSAAVAHVRVIALRMVWPLCGEPGPMPGPCSEAAGNLLRNNSGTPKKAEGGFLTGCQGAGSHSPGSTAVGALTHSAPVLDLGFDLRA